MKTSFPSHHSSLSSHAWSEAMRLLDDERQVLLGEIDAVVEQLRNAEAREVYAELRAAVEAGEVTGGLLPPLGRLLEMGLGTAPTPHVPPPPRAHAPPPPLPPPPP